MKRLNNKVIIVAGGSGLIGAAIVEHILAEGGLAINADQQVKNAPGEGTVTCDVTDETSVNEAIVAVTGKYGRIDGLVNCAYPRTKDWSAKFEDITAASWRQNVDMQLGSVFTFCSKVISCMKQQESGSIVNIGSIYGITGPDFSIYEGTDMTLPAAYSAIKGGVINFTRYLAAYCGSHGIRVNCVSPGGVLNGQPDLFVKNYEKKVPLGRMCTAADIAPSVSFLLSDEASYISGHNLVIDGGWTAV